MPKKKIDRIPTAHKEYWCCPACGEPVNTYVAKRRVIACSKCRWLFQLIILENVPKGRSLEVQAKKYANDL